jgi:pentatricopeptide repeat protein
MDLPLFFPSPSTIETSIYKYINQTHLHLRLALHTNSYHLYFYGRRSTPASTVIAAAVKQRWRNKVETSREVSAAANTHGNRSQCTQMDIHKHEWNDMIIGYVKNGFFSEVLRMYYQMQGSGIELDESVFISVINACGSLLDLQAGKKVHEDIIARGFESNASVGNALASMYVKCRSLKNARQVFDQMPERNVVSWNAIIAGCSKNGHPYEALAFFYEMHVEGIKPDSITIISVLSACAHLLALEQGKQIHGYAIRSGFGSVIVVGNVLVGMYAKCGNVNIAYKLFERMPKRNVVSWNAIITGYSQNDHPNEALFLFEEMQVQGIKPNPITLISVLPACAKLLALQQGKQIHGYAVRRGFESDVVMGTGFVDMYSKCGNVNIAHKLFERMPKKNIVSWNAIIAGYSRNGQPHEALEFFAKMQVLDIKPNPITIVNVLPACADLLALEKGEQIHCYAIRNAFESNVVVGTGLVDMYAKCGDVNIAHKLFEKMPRRDVVLWNAIIVGYSQNGQPHEAVTLFNEMQIQGVKPDSVTVVSVLPACAHLLAMEHGKQIHGYAIRSGFESDVGVGNALVDMYAKCGHIGIARQVFDKMSNRDVISLNAMILGYGIHGHGEDALALFNQMQQTGTTPDHITFIGVLIACSHTGLVDEGWKYFECMKSDYGLAPKLEHYACLVDLLGRAGYLDEAHDIIKKMPFDPHSTVWGALLGACRIHCNIELAEQAAEHLFELEPNNAGYYVLLSNIYAEAGRWEDVAKLRTMMKEREVKKQPGYSFIEVNKEVHTFLVGDRAHPQSEKIYAMLETLYGQMKEAGFVPNTNLVLQDVEEEMKENMLCSHSERLAIAFGIINSSPCTPIRIMKNLRVCNDCHNATKFISRVVGREIIVRDANRFHHFKVGLCSCGDYW